MWMAPAGAFFACPQADPLHPASHDTVDKRMHYVHQEGRARFQIRGCGEEMSELACHVLERNGLTSSDLALVVPHQANLRDYSRDAGAARRWTIRRFW